MNDTSTAVEQGMSARLDDVADERLISRIPIVVRRRVRWGECDPARVVYTPRYAEYLAAAYSWFMRIVLFEKLMADDGTRLATPIKAFSLEFEHTLRPDDLFDMTVHVSSIRKRTFDLVIIGQSPAREPRFVGLLSPIVVNDDFRSVDFPLRIGQALSAYRERCPAPPSSLARSELK